MNPPTINAKEKDRGINDKKANSNKNEIFVDVFEKISILFNATGYVINSSIEGCILMKSFL